MRTNLLLFIVAIMVLPEAMQGQMASRLISYYHNSAIPATYSDWDSTSYYYSFGRAPFVYSPYNPTVKFDSSYQLVHPTNTNWQYIHLQTFDQHDNILSSTERIKLPNGPFGNTSRHLYTYNANSVLVCDRYEVYQNDSDAVTQQTDTFMYDLNGDLDTLLTISSQPNGNINWGDKMVYTYDNSHNVLSQTDLRWDTTAQVWMNASRATYTYSNNQLASKVSQLWLGSWTNDIEDQYTYNVNNELEMDVKQYWYNNTWIYSSKDSNVYQNGNVARHRHDEWNVDSNKWLRYSTDTTGYDANNNKVFTLTSSWDAPSQAYYSANRMNYAYNNYNQPLYIGSEDSVAAGWSQRYFSRYHYEEYMPTRTQAAQSVKVQVKLYPSPASDALNLDVSSQKEEPFTISIYDIRGRVIRQWYEKDSRNFHMMVPLASVENGNYVLCVKDRTGPTNIQFTVAH